MKCELGRKDDQLGPRADHHNTILCQPSQSAWAIIASESSVNVWDSLWHAYRN